MKKIDMETHFLSQSLYRALKARTEPPYLTEEDINV